MYSDRICDFMFWGASQHTKLLSVILKAIYQQDKSQKYDM